MQSVKFQAFVRLKDKSSAMFPPCSFVTEKVLSSPILAPIPISLEVSFHTPFGGGVEPLEATLPLLWFFLA